MVKTSARSFVVFILLVGVLAIQPVRPVYAAGLIVNTNADNEIAGDTFCTLREAVINANTDSDLTSGDCTAGSGADTITFDAGLSGGTIIVPSQLEFLEDVTIDGSDLASKITISGGDSTRVFLVASGVTATLDSLIVTQGRVEGCCGAGLLNNGTLTITNSLFSANNNNNGVGGAIMNTASGTLTVTGSTISGNSASNGGGIGNENQMTITNSTISANSSGDAGGGIHNSDTLTVTNSTFSGNTASTNGFGSGGGIFSSGSLTVRNSTFSGNSAQFDAGGIAQDAQVGGMLNLSNTIIANSLVVDTSSETDCRSQSAIGINTNNLVEHGGNNCSSTLNADPNLDDLDNYGGTTQTFALLANSPAIDAGNDATCAAAPVSNLDQRGITRPNGGHCDIGAYEYVDTTAPTVTAFSVPASPTTLNIPITAFTASDDAILTGYLITESATPPLVGDSGWTATAPTTYPVASMGSHTLYPWVKDAAGHVSAIYGSPAVANITCLTPITVTNTNDSGAGSLRQALIDTCVGDINNISMIDFDPALAGGTIHLASELTITKNVTIDGSDLTSRLTISGDTDPVGATLPDGTGDGRVLNISGGAPGLTAMLDSLIVTKGVTQDGIPVVEDGAGLYMEQGMHVTIKNSTFSDNHAAGNGGGILNTGVLTLIDSTISGNSAAGGNGGGGIQNSAGITITNSTISNNTATGGGASGGGMASNGGATITNSTFFGNSSFYGGGIMSIHNFTITNSTIAGNSAVIGGGISFQGNTAHLRNTIIAGNSASGIGSDDDCDNDGATIATNTMNLIQDGSCSPFISGDALLGALADNGGPTQTMALLAGSNAIDAGDDAICAGNTNPNPVNNLDQRGVARPDSAHCDIGAYEYEDDDDPTVTVFNVPSYSNSFNIPITTFTASDDATVAGYLITQTSTPPSASAPSWTVSVPTTYTVGSAGSYTLYPWAKDALNNVSALFSPAASVTVDLNAPVVLSSTRTGASPTNAASVNFSVFFSEPVTSVDTADFSLTTTDSVNSASVTGVSGGPQIYTVSVNTGSRNGTIRLNVLDNDSIQDNAGNLLAGAFNSGEAYTIDKTVTLILKSVLTQDGWVLESTETSDQGGSLNTDTPTIHLGDNAANKQFRGILSFNTGAIPNTALITSVTLKVKKQSVTGGGNPLTTFQGFMVDIKKGHFGTPALQITDFQTLASKTYGPFSPALLSNWYSINLTNGKAYINKLSTASGLTQIRLRFKLDDNNNSIANYLSIYSGNSPAANRPQLEIKYVP